MRRAVLQQAVGEAAGRGADVEAAAARRVEAERRQRVGELHPAARDEARALVDGDLDRRDRRAGRASARARRRCRGAPRRPSPTRPRASATRTGRARPAGCRGGRGPRARKRTRALCDSFSHATGQPARRLCRTRWTPDLPPRGPSEIAARRAPDNNHIAVSLLPGNDPPSPAGRFVRHSRRAFAIRTWTWSSWCAIACTTPGGPPSPTCSPTNANCAPAATKRLTRSCASARSTSRRVPGGSSSRSARG